MTTRSTLTTTDSTIGFCGRAHRLPFVVATLCLLAVTFVASTAMTPSAFAAEAGDRIDLKVLVLSANGFEASFQAWTAALKREGVPFDTIIANEAGPITSDTLTASPTHARYQAVILATGGLLECTALGCFSALDAGEWAALNSFQTRFGVRRVVAYTYPTPEFGLNYPFHAGDLAGTPAQLTTAGKAAFGYLRVRSPSTRARTATTRRRSPPKAHRRLRPWSLVPLTPLAPPLRWSAFTIAPTASKSWSSRSTATPISCTRYCSHTG